MTMNKNELQQEMLNAIKTGDITLFEQLAQQSGQYFGSFLNTLVEQYHFPLTLATLKGHTGIVAYMLQNGADVNQKDQLDGNAPLHLAAEGGDVPMAELLLQHKANLRATTSDGRFLPLHFAAGNGRAEIIDLLLAAGAKVDAKSLTRQTPLYNAAENGHLAVVELLITKGAKVNMICDSGGDTALTAACYGNHISTVNYLLQQGASPNGLGDENPGDFYASPLSRATNAEVVDLLIKAGADVNAKNRHNDTALHDAVRRANAGPADAKWEQRLGVVKALLANGADPLAKNNSHVNTPLALSKWPALTELLRKGADKNAAVLNSPEAPAQLGESLIRMAHNCDTEGKIVSFLDLVKQAVASDICYISVKDNNATLLHSIIASAPFNHSYSQVPFAPYLQTVNLLLDKGADVNAVGHLRTETPLHIAVRRSTQAGRYNVTEYHAGYIELIRLLLSCGAGLGVLNKHGATVLDLATYGPVIDLLKAQGATYNTLDSEVVDEIKAGRMEVFDKGMPIEITDKDGNTPLLMAAMKNSVPAIEYLVKRGADIQVRNTNWKTNVLDLACYSGSFDVIRYIVSHLPLDINARDPESADTALHYLAAWQPNQQHKDPNILKQQADDTCIWMVQQGADINLQNKTGKTVLDVARTKKLAADMTKAAKKK